MLRDKIVMGVYDKHLQKKMLEATDLTLDKAIEMARAAEVTKQHAKEMNKSGSSDNYAHNGIRINAVQGDSKANGSSNNVHVRNKAKYNENNNGNKKLNENKNYDFRKNVNFRGRNGNASKNCRYCTQLHAPGKCPAFDKTCRNCGKKNHFVSACNFNKIRELKIRSKDDEIYIDAVHYENLNFTRSWFEKIKINNYFIKFKLDTGADLNVMPISYCQKIKGAKLNKTKSHLEAYGGFQLNVIGTVNLLCCTKTNRCMLEFVVVDEKTIPLLGLRSCIQLNLVQRVDNIQLA